MGIRYKGIRALTLAEVMLAIGLLAVALLALIAQSTLLAKSNQKHDDHGAAADVGQAIMARFSQGARRDHPPGTNQAVWDANSVGTPYAQGTETIGFTEYRYELFVSDVMNTASGAVLGTGETGAENPDTKLKRFDIKVVWWEGNDGSKSGVGRLEVDGTRLVKVTRIAP